MTGFPVAISWSQQGDPHGLHTMGHACPRISARASAKPTWIRQGQAPFFLCFAFDLEMQNYSQAVPKAGELD